MGWVGVGRAVVRGVIYKKGCGGSLKGSTWDVWMAVGEGL